MNVLARIATIAVVCMTSIPVYGSLVGAIEQFEGRDIYRVAGCLEIPDNSGGLGLTVLLNIRIVGEPSTEIGEFRCGVAAYCENIEELAAYETVLIPSESDEETWIDISNYVVEEDGLQCVDIMFGDFYGWNVDFNIVADSEKSNCGMRHFGWRRGSAMRGEELSYDPRMGVERLLVAPNPANVNIMIARCDKEYGAGGSLEIYDIAGRRVAKLSVSEGVRRVDWRGVDGNGRRVASGVYKVLYKVGRKVAGIARVTIIH